VVFALRRKINQQKSIPFAQITKILQNIKLKGGFNPTPLAYTPLMSLTSFVQTKWLQKRLRHVSYLLCFECNVHNCWWCFFKIYATN